MHVENKTIELAAGQLARTFSVLLILVTAQCHLLAGVLEKGGIRDYKLPSVTPHSEGAIVISGVALKRGSPRDAVMRGLSKSYGLQKLKSAEGEEDSWLISEKEQSDNYVGVVSFAAGKVRRVARFQKWTQDDDSVELAQRLCDLLEKLTSERGNQANIVTRTTDSGKISVRGVELVFGDKRVSFTVISRGDADSRQIEVHLDEVVQ